MVQEKQMRQLGASGISVPPLGIGTNKWALGKNDETVFQAFHASLDAGLTLFDTADSYGFGKSERLLGESIKRDPRPVVIASKFLPLPTRQFGKALDGTLRRLGIQTIDLYYIHAPLAKIEPLMDQMAQAVRDGKIRAVGVSNYNAKQMRRAAERLARYDIPLAANEVYYNLLHRKPEVNGVLDACRELNVALVAYFPLASGRLTVSRTPGASSGASRNTNGKSLESLQETLSEIAQKRGKSVSQVTLNWLLRRDEHIIAIPGATSARHALENAEALTWELSDDEFAAIDLASAPWKR